MNPAANATASGGIAGALTVIVTWLLALAHLTVPAEVQASVSVLLTAGIGYGLHIRTLPAIVHAAVAPAPSTTKPITAIPPTH